VLPEIVGNREPVELTQKSTSGAQSALPSVGTVMKQETTSLAGGEPHPALTQVPTEVPKVAAMALPDKNDPVAPADVGQGKKVLALSDLPASIQQEIPGISISFHAYSSKPKDRHVMINGSMAGQGEILAPGLSLDEITPDGVILGYKGYRFRRGVR
jgi:general secretion pathway protein B